MEILSILLTPLLVLATLSQNGSGALHNETIRAQKCRSYALLQPSSEELSLAQEYPHVVQIAYKPNDATIWQCQGSLVSTRYVLTAAQCISNDLYGPPIKVRLGILSPEPVEQNIEKLHTHPSYTEHSLYDDIGLIKMFESIIFTDYIRPLCLPDDDITANLYYRLNYRFQRTEPDFIPILEWHQLEPIANDQCTQYFRSILSANRIRNGFRDTQLCLRETAYMTGACGGYSGAPLLVPHPNVQFINTQIGITIYGRRCNYRNPEGYTRVYKYVDWIENVVWALDDGK